MVWIDIIIATTLDIIFGISWVKMSAVAASKAEEELQAIIGSFSEDENSFMENYHYIFALSLVLLGHGFLMDETHSLCVKTNKNIDEKRKMVQRSNALKQSGDFMRKIYKGFFPDREFNKKRIPSCNSDERLFHLRRAISFHLFNKYKFCLESKSIGGNKEAIATVKECFDLAKNFYEMAARFYKKYTENDFQNSRNCARLGMAQFEEGVRIHKRIKFTTIIVRRRVKVPASALASAPPMTSSPAAADDTPPKTPPPAPTATEDDMPQERPQTPPPAPAAAEDETLERPQTPPPAEPASETPPPSPNYSWQDCIMESRELCMICVKKPEQYVWPNCHGGVKEGLHGACLDCVYRWNSNKGEPYECFLCKDSYEYLCGDDKKAYHPNPQYLKSEREMRVFKKRVREHGLTMGTLETKEKRQRISATAAAVAIAAAPN